MKLRNLQKLALMSLVLENLDYETQFRTYSIASDPLRPINVIYLYSSSFQLCTLHNGRCKPNRNQWPSISSMNDDVSRRTNWTIARRQCLGPLGKMKSVHWGHRSIMQGAASVSSYNGGSQGLPASGKQDVVSDVLRYPRRRTVHTGWASRTLEAKEKRRCEGTVRLSGHMWTPCRRWTGRVYDSRAFCRVAQVAYARPNLPIRRRAFGATSDLLIVCRSKFCSVIVVCF